ncbi:T9SS type A sorting domain-containing protein [bacterium]|nr:T9SS type A sorting domain-containing protein [bacterium]MBU1985041.1 T9SS type A sorting domain-containing protein [bacterium]
MQFRPYFSPDFGDTWELRDSGFPTDLGVTAVAVNPSNPQNLMASVTGPVGTNLGPWMSTDQGLSWRPLMDRHYVTNPFFNEWSQTGWYSDGAHGWFAVFVFQGGGYDYVTADSGLTWDSLGPVNESARFHFFAHPSLPNIALWQGDRLYRTLDFGYHWEACTGPFSNFIFGTVGNAPEQIFAIAYCRVALPHPHLVNVPVVSSDTGRTWQLVNPVDTIYWDNREWELVDIIGDPLRQDHMLGLAIDSVFETTDAGQTWLPIIGDTSIFRECLGYASPQDWLFSAAPGYAIGTSRPVGVWRWRRGLSIDSDRPVQSTSQVTIRLFPNPVTSGGTLTLELPGQPLRSVVLYNLLGQEVYRHSVSHHHNTGGTQVFLTLPSGIPSGIYFVNVTTNRQSVVRKVIIQR